MVEAVPPGGQDSTELTSPFDMEVRLRAAVRETSGLEEGYVNFPYIKSFHDLPISLNFRRRVDSLDHRDRFSLDIGTFSDGGDKFYSMAYADFRIHKRRSRKGKNPIGLLCLLEPVAFFNNPYQVVRSFPMIQRFEGIHVADDIRGNGVGRSLISAARVVLDETGVRLLMLDQIKIGVGPGGEFYRHLGGRRFDISRMPAMLMPTRTTPSLPYLFT